MTPAERILAWLRASAVPLSGEELARRLGCSRAAVWKHMARLRARGYAIAARHARGYVLAAVPDRVGPAELAPDRMARGDRLDAAACARARPGRGRGRHVRDRRGAERRPRTARPDVALAARHEPLLLGGVAAAARARRRTADRARRGRRRRRRGGGDDDAGGRDQVAERRARRRPQGGGRPHRARGRARACALRDRRHRREPQHDRVSRRAGRAGDVARARDRPPGRPRRVHGPALGRARGALRAVSRRRLRCRARGVGGALRAHGEDGPRVRAGRRGLWPRARRRRRRGASASHRRGRAAHRRGGGHAALRDARLPAARGALYGRTRRMLLAFNVNNTHTLIGLYQGERRAVHWRISTDPARTVDEYGVLLRGLFAEWGNPRPEITGVALSSVVPPVNDRIEEVSRRFFAQ